MSLDENKKLAAAIKRLEKLTLSQAFDASVPNSRPTAQQEQIFKDIGKVQYRWVIAGNQSGKSQTAAREIAWFIQDEHPYFKRPKEWGDEPLLMIVAGQSRENMATQLWQKKIKPFLDAAEWKETRVGGLLTSVESRKTGAKIIFLSHSDSSDKARQMMQGYVAHYVWLDEMPQSKNILHELQERVASRKGRFIATFTPKFRNDEIRKIIDAAREPVGKKYQLFKLMNPVYSGREQEEMQKLDGYSESYKKTVLEGAWTTGDQSVYDFDYESMTVDTMPESYSTGWRHVVSLDPANRSKFGYTLWAENPANGTWYLVRDEYLQGDEIKDPNRAFELVNKRNEGYNVVRQVCDPHEGWFIGLAAAKGVYYHTPYDKNSRKTELIKGLQMSLSSGKIKIPRWNSTFIDEIQSCQYSETADRIVNASSYHTLDTSQYFADCMPKWDPGDAPITPYQAIKQANRERKEREAREKSLGTRRIRRPLWKRMR